ncbi:MAG: 2-dehydropantoate 2-reductase [Acidobacteria bacterium]|nr:2-dehydropantoate 2-reductase [Acidobacteriota bacterium]
MNIAVIGAGAVGGYFGGRLAAAGHQVTFIARGATLHVLRTQGLHITSPLRGDAHIPVRATDQPDEVGPVDVVLSTVKLYDLEASATAMRPLIGPGTVVIPLQNGVDARAMLMPLVGADHVAAGIAYIVAVADRPGHITHVTADRLVFGEADGSTSARLQAFAEAGRQAGFVTELTPVIETELWIKFVRLSTWSAMTGVTRSPMGVIKAYPSLMTMMDQALEEAVGVGHGRGIVFPPTLRDATQQLVRNFPYGSKSSMLEDLERGRRLELPWLSGAVARMGAEAGVPTPVHSFVSTVLAPFVAGPPVPPPA